MKVFARRRSWFSIGLPLALAALVVVAGAWRLWSSYRGTQDVRAGVEARHARLEGLLQASEALQRASEDADFRLGRFAYPASLDKARVEADFQQRVRKAFEGAGMTVRGSQVTKGKTNKGFEEMVVNVTAQGPIEALQAALIALQRERPRMFVETATVSPDRTRRPGVPQGAPLSVQITVSTVRITP